MRSTLGAQGVILAIGLTAVLALAASTSAFTAGDLIMAQGLLTQLWGPLQFLGWFYRELRQSLVDMDAFFQILQTKPQLPDGHLALPAPPSSAGIKLFQALQHHAYVQLIYWLVCRERSGPEAEQPRAGKRLRSGPGAGDAGCDLWVQCRQGSAQRGQHQGRTRQGALPVNCFACCIKIRVPLSKSGLQSCAIVGTSGSGKSTLLRILMRLYDVQSGAVLLEGINVQDLRQASLRGNVAVVPQDTVLFNTTILENIAYGNPKASREEVLRAAGVHITCCCRCHIYVY